MRVATRAPILALIASVGLCHASKQRGASDAPAAVDASEEDSGSSEEQAERQMDRRLRRIQQNCGELCDIRRPTIAHPNERFNHSMAPMPCGWLLADDTGIDATLEQSFPPLKPPAKWMDEFTMHGRFPLRAEYFNSSREMQAGNELKIETLRDGTRVTDGWSEARISGLVRQATGKVPPPQGRPAGATPTMLGYAFWTRYHNLNRELWVGLHQAKTNGSNVLVIGSQTPWVEGLCLGAGAAHVYTLEYGKIFTNHPQVTTFLPVEFLSKARDGSLPPIDVVVTASSLEHSGLGRYNDGLNPWGDILAVARGWCVGAPHARLVVAVPTTVSASGLEAMNDEQAAKYGQDVLSFNGQRTYGPVRYPYLTTNWRFDQRIYNGNTPGWAQTVYTFKKANNHLRMGLNGQSAS